MKKLSAVILVTIATAAILAGCNQKPAPVNNAANEGSATNGSITIKDANNGTTGSISITDPNASSSATNGSISITPAGEGSSTNGSITVTPAKDSASNGSITIAPVSTKDSTESANKALEDALKAAEAAKKNQ